MAAQDLHEMVESLTPEQQAVVRRLIEALKDDASFLETLRRQISRTDTPFLQAVNEFMGEHPELLRRLAQ